MLIFMIELITEFIYVLHELMWHQSKLFQKEKKKFSQNTLDLNLMSNSMDMLGSLTLNN